MDWVRNFPAAGLSSANDHGLPEPATGLGDSEKRVAIRRAMDLHREVEQFHRRWPESPVSEAPGLHISWRHLERQLADLAGDPVKARMARDWVSATRKTAPFKPTEMVLREILCTAWALMDEGFQPEADWASGAQTPVD